MKEYRFSYRGGEITAVVHAADHTDAWEKLEQGEVETYQVEGWNLHGDMWEPIDADGLAGGGDGAE